MKITKAIGRRRPVDVVLFNGKLVYTGICLAATKQLVVIVNFNFQEKKFDGYTIFKNKDFNTYRVWKKNQLKITTDNINHFVEQYKTNKYKNFYDWFKLLFDDKLVSIFIEKKLKTYFVGKIVEVNSTAIQIHILNKKAKWKDIKTFKIDDIDFLSFDTNYEKKLMKKIKESRKD